MDLSAENQKDLEFDEFKSSQIIFSQSPVAIEFFSKEGKLIDANPACLELFGLESVVSVFNYNLFDDPHVPADVRTNIRNGKPSRFEINFDFNVPKERNFYQTSRNGSCFLECFIKPWFTPEGEIGGYIANVLDIAERKKTEALLSKTEETYQAVYDFVSEAIFLQEIDSWKILDVNKAMLKMFGYEFKDEVTGLSVGQLSSNISPFTDETAFRILNSASQNEPQNFEWQARKKDGTIFWIELSVKEILLGGQRRIITVGRDITKRKEAENALQENEKKYRTLIQYSSDPIFSFNPDYTYRFVNEAFARPFGKNPDKIIGTTPYHIFSPEEATKRLKIVQKVFETGEKAEIEVRVDSVSGDIQYYLTMADPVKSDSGKVEYVTCVSKDITQRKQTEKALYESRERYRNLIELAVDGVLMGSGDGIIIDANSCVCEMTGRTKEQLIGLYISDSFFTPESIAKKPFDFEGLKNGEIIISERDILKSDGSVLNVEMRTRMMPDGTYQSILRDITDRKRIEAELKQRNTELSVFNSAKDKFLSIIAHDLKNPFNAILGFTDLLLANLDELDNEELIKGLDIIKSASIQAYKLLENLLHWANNQTGRTQFNPEKLNISEQIQESLSIVETMAIQKNITFRVQADKSLHAQADKNMLDTILRNLISNAVKYSYNGSTIGIEAAVKTEMVCISVSDQGIGISQNRIPTLFKIDKRSNTPGTANEQGTGLGLILCKDFVDRHGGKLWVESTPEKGTIFTFCLP